VSEVPDFVRGTSNVSRRAIRPAVERSYRQHIDNWLVPHLGTSRWSG
jgi:hypothetical protein